MASPRPDTSVTSVPPTERRGLSPRTYRTIALVVLVLLAVITLTGSLVRLTGSGLGCSEWPRCEEADFIKVSNPNQAVEQINRLFTGLVSVAIILAVLGSLWRRPRRRDLTWLSLGLVGGMVAQIVMGGIVVLTHVHPAAVQGHFLISMAILLNAMVLFRRAGEPDDVPLEPTVSPGLRSATGWLLAVAALVVVTGTVVTGTGPHGGDADARRFGFEISDVARVHGITVVVFLVLTLAVAYRARRRAADWEVLAPALTALLVVLVLQAVVGYTQYFSGVPVGLVAVHIGGAIAVWLATVNLRLTTRGPVPGPARTAPAPQSAVATR